MGHVFYVETALSDM